MIDTSTFETDVIITKMNESGNIQQIDLVDHNGNHVDICKYRVVKQKKQNLRDLNEL